ncbi:MAG: redoxin domain-containing protein [Candidatus Eremiobacteraeota bacterium]|nr:redoxin domain-containing protein [Candidatus Eremiobacteraeota bacterium]
MAVKIGRTSTASKTSTLSAGASAPEIALKTHTGDDFKLSDLRGKNVLLAFYPFAFTPT